MKNDNQLYTKVMEKLDFESTINLGRVINQANQITEAAI